MDRPGNHCDPDRPLPAVYFQTVFAAESIITDWPFKFAIITAWAPTGETWTGEQNRKADRRLFDELSALGVWLKRITGQTPDGSHAEPGWGVAIPFEAACDIGARYEQVGIYYVFGDRLLVSFCDHRRKPIDVDTFRKRLLAPNTGG